MDSVQVLIFSALTELINGLQIHLDELAIHSRDASDWEAPHTLRRTHRQTAMSISVF